MMLLLRMNQFGLLGECVFVIQICVGMVCSAPFGILE